MTLPYAIGIALSIHTMIWAHEEGSAIFELLALLAIVGWLCKGDRDEEI